MPASRVNCIYVDSFGHTNPREALVEYAYRQTSFSNDHPLIVDCFLEQLRSIGKSKKDRIATSHYPHMSIQKADKHLCTSEPTTPLEHRVCVDTDRSTLDHKLNFVVFNSFSRLSPNSSYRYPFCLRYSLNLTSSLSKSLDISGIKIHAIIAPTAANAAPIRKTPRTPASGLSKESWMGVKTCVPIAAPALPTAAARPRKWPRRGVGKDSAPQRNVAT